jgi:N-formylglutamate amidohydrolase
MAAFALESPTVSEAPIVLSVPHCGTAFPDELRDQYKPEYSNTPDDTDWFVDTLYSFAPSMGITLLRAVYSRWVIDLNRDPKNKPLYSDGRITTGLCPVTDFFGNLIYKDGRTQVDANEINRRAKQYYDPYHGQLIALINAKKEKFGKVLLWDCHSIRQFVPTIHKERFPDLILGDVDETSAASEITSAALKQLKKGPYNVVHNHPFKGGYITRQYGVPSGNIHALQLEMSKVVYMNDAEEKYDEQRAGRVQKLLKETLSVLIDILANK